MRVRFYNIQWDTDGDDVELPSEVTLEVNNDLHVNNEGAEVLSDRFSYCVFAFDFEIV